MINHPSLAGNDMIFLLLYNSAGREQGGIVSMSARIQCTSQDPDGRVNNVLLQTRPAALAGTDQEEKTREMPSLRKKRNGASFSNLEKDLMPRAGPFQLHSPAAPATSGSFVGISNAVLKKTRSCSLDPLLQRPVSLGASQVLCANDSAPRPAPGVRVMPGEEAEV